MYEVEVENHRCRYIDGNSVPKKIWFHTEAVYGVPYLETEWKICRELVGSRSRPKEFEHIVFIDTSEAVYKKDSMSLVRIKGVLYHQGTPFIRGIYRIA